MNVLNLFGVAITLVTFYEFIVSSVSHNNDTITNPTQWRDYVNVI